MEKEKFINLVFSEFKEEKLEFKNLHFRSFQNLGRCFCFRLFEAHWLHGWVTFQSQLRHDWSQRCFKAVLDVDDDVDVHKRQKLQRNELSLKFSFVLCLFCDSGFRSKRLILRPRKPLFTFLSLKVLSFKISTKVKSFFSSKLVF